MALEALGGEMADFGGAHSRQQVLGAERPRKVVDAHFENGDAVDLAIGVAARNDLAAGERAPRLRNQLRVEAVEVEVTMPGASPEAPSPRISPPRRLCSRSARESIAAVFAAEPRR